ncbi:molybdopterin-binding protein [Chachezhania sediminis]|uniref:molybdopterin-binding protein n=1 Tax=Chachezhania sediminis TaxID=2599291 RepID=UPI00131D51E5|nr:molybdopterin-binding protein [Chachezhania sediminis]
MKFGPRPVAEAAGTILAHSISLPDGRLRKGASLGTAEIARLQAAGLTEIIVAAPDTGDIDENEAADRLARALVPDPAAVGLRRTDAFTGRVNLIAESPGVVVVDADAIDRFNAVNPMITVATLAPFQQVAPGNMVATVKIIAYAVPDADVDAAIATATNAIRVAPPAHASAGLVVTSIPGGPDDAKGIRVIGERLTALGLTLDGVETVPHRTPDLAAALGRAPGDMVLILTGSATSDPNDVAPSAVRAAGGMVTRFGMPVDPGNLLFLGDLGPRPVIGLPGCARSPALNGADWVLSRVACGIAVSAADIAGMGVGGLLKEIPTRSQPRAGRKR